MFDCTKILVVFNPHTDQQPALSRAVILARSFETKVHLVSCIYDDAYDNSEMLTSGEKEHLKASLLEQQEERLKLACAQYSDLIIEQHTLWEKKLHKGIIDAAKIVGADLIVKSCKMHDKLGHRLFTPSDWHLLRESAVNVLMVKDKCWPEQGKIVAAISVDANDNEHQDLDKFITNAGQGLAQALDAELHIANTFVGAPVHIAIEVPSFSADEYNSDVKDRHLSLIKEVAEPLNVTSDKLHVKEGLPEDIIPLLCDELDAELLIVGSIGRTGLSAAFLGNTAEHIIDKIDCDTLVIKAEA